MPFLICALAVGTVVLLWCLRTRAAHDAAEGLLDVANDVRLAARRLNLTRRTDLHPSDSIDDPKLAAAGIVAAVAEMAGHLTAAQIQAMHRCFRTTFRATEEEEHDMVAFGRWIAGQFGTPDEADRRLARIVRTQAGPDAEADLLAMTRSVVAADGMAANPRQQEALQRLHRTFAA